MRNLALAHHRNAPPPRPADERQAHRRVPRASGGHLPRGTLRSAVRRDALVCDSVLRRNIGSVAAADVVRTHQDIVNALYDQLRLKLDRGIKIVNDSNRDLALTAKDGRVQTLFEIKTTGDRQSIFTAIGQLFFNRNDSRTQLVIVAPKVFLDVDVALSKLSMLGISVVGYTESRAKITFHGLDAVLAH